MKSKTEKEPTTASIERAKAVDASRMARIIQLRSDLQYLLSMLMAAVPDIQQPRQPRRSERRAGRDRVFHKGGVKP